MGTRFIGDRLGFGAPDEWRGSSASVPRGTRRASGGGATAMGGAARLASSLCPTALSRDALGEEKRGRKEAVDGKNPST
jgi:hypothetical protein